jgi:hypothetical protein
MNLLAEILLSAAFVSSFAPPAPAESLTAGTSLESALSTLNSRGHRIVYSSALVKPEMTLRTAPTATRIGDLLEQILAPWNLRAVQAGNGDWLVVAAPAQNPAAALPPAEEPEESVESIDVTASRFALAISGTSTFLDRADVEQMPHLADDAVRMLKIFPGISGGDFSAGLNIRGGRRDEALLMIDGAEIHNAFHFRDLDGALSVLDTNLVDGIDLITGGMTAEYGDYMSGVVNMNTRRPRVEDDYRSTVGVSFVSAYGRTGGSFSDGRGSWLASLRRGFLDVVMKRMQPDDETITPRYTDLFATLQYDFSDRTSLSLHTLLGNDDLQLISEEPEDDIEFDGDGRASHFWVTLDHDFGAVDAETVAAMSDVRQTRDAQGVDDERFGDVLSDFRFRFVDLRQNWSWNVRERHLARWGVNVGRAQADYDYRLIATIFDPRAPGGAIDISRAANLHVDGDKYGLYASWRSRFGDAFTLEAGGRWDSYRYAQGLKFDVVSPRINAVYALGRNSELRAAWGIMHQPQGIDQLQIEDGITNFFQPERARQTVFSYLRRFDGGISARIDVYRKDYARLRARFENALDSAQLIPEGAIDRVRIDAPEAEARGVELTLRRETDRGLGGWISVVSAEARDREAQRWVARTWDQEHALSFGVGWTAHKWNLNFAGLIHSGTPTTHLGGAVVTRPGGLQEVVVVPGPRNRARLGPYARVDARLNRDVPLRNGKFSWYFEITNLFDRKNPCCVEDFEANGRVADPRVITEESNWLPMLPSLGFQYEF